MIVSSIQVGQVRTEGDPEASDPNQKQWTSAFRKTTVDGAVMAGQTGLSGDAVANEQHHGGIDKAVLAYAAKHYPDWRSEVPELAAHDEFGPGGFAENLTIEGADEANVCVGDRYRAGECLFEVSQPRQPCWKIGRRWQLSTLTKQVAKSGRTGWYLRVLETGQITAGDNWDLVERFHPQWTIAACNEVLFAKNKDAELVAQLSALPELAAEWKESL